MGKRKDDSTVMSDASAAVAEAPKGADAPPATEPVAVEAAKDVPAEAIPLAPELSKTEPPKIEVAPADDKTELPKVELQPSASASPPSANAAAPKPGAAPANDAAPARSRRFAMLAASIALVAAVGAFAGSLGASGLAKLQPEPSVPAAAKTADADTLAALKALAADVAALKANLDAGSKSANVQFARIAERLDRIERRAQGAAVAPDTTGSVSTARAAAEPLPSPRPSAAERAVVDGWVLRDIFDGRALVESRIGGLYEVVPGVNLPGLGRVESIRRQDGRWVVVTARGLITSLR